MANKITGRVLEIGQLQSMPYEVDGKQGVITRRELVLDATRYNPYTGERDGIDNCPAIEFKNDRCALLDNLREGDAVTVSFSLRGRAYADRATGQRRYFTRVEGFAVEPAVYRTDARTREPGGMPPQQTGGWTAAAPQTGGVTAAAAPQDSAGTPAGGWQDMYPAAKGRNAQGPEPLTAGLPF